MHKVDTTKGSLNSAVSHQWANRPDDQKFLSLSDLYNQVAVWADESRNLVVEPRRVTAVAQPDNGMEFMVDGVAYTPNNYGFGSVARVANAPSAYLRNLPAPLAALNINYGLKSAKQDEAAFYVRENPEGGNSLRAVTSPSYGRIFDRDVVAAVQVIAGNGTGDTPWKVPGVIDWGTSMYNPHVDITKETTTLYASDRDVFLFLVDDLHPVEVGKLKDGSPDLLFRGFYIWNSEVGARSFGMACMYLRGVCQNRNLWGVEGFQQVVWRHTSNAPDRFITDAAPSLLAFTHSNSHKLVAGVKAAKGATIGANDEAVAEWLQGVGFSRATTAAVMSQHLLEEGEPIRSVWDAAQGITAFARQEPVQERRIALEQQAGRLLDKVAA